MTVGADAHIGLAECIVFTEIFGEFVTSQRADVGIGPYKTFDGRHTAKGADRVVRPYSTNEKSSPQNTTTSSILNCS